MNKKLAYIFPGQGAQYPGMGKDFYDNFQEARQVFAEADDLLNQHFSQLMFATDAKTLSLTKNAQLALYINSLATLKVIEKNFPEIFPTVTLGLSLGEYSAICAAKKMDFSSGLRLVQRRSEAMQKCSEKKIGTMAAILPASEDIVQKVLTPHQKQGLPVFIANLNCPGQVVIAGKKEDIEKVSLDLKENGIKKIIFLEVSGAFHTEFMEDAKIDLMEAIHQTKFHDSDVDLIMNVTGAKVSSLEELKKNLEKQVTSIVYWQKSIEAAAKLPVEHFIEIGAGKSLTNMNKKIHNISSISIEKVSDLEQLQNI